MSATPSNEEFIHPKVIAFRAKRVGHPKVKAALAALIRATLNPRPESIHVLIGPGGSGKSTIAEKLKQHLAAYHADRMKRDPGFLPYVSVEAVAGFEGNYNWKDGLVRILVAGGEILVSQKALNRFEVELDGERIGSVRALLRDELRRALENMVKHRKKPVLIIDEASAILLSRRGVVPVLQFEILKSLAVLIKSPIVLVGAYDLLGVLDGTGQLVRRSDVIHLARYTSDGTTEDEIDGKVTVISDREHFASVLLTLLIAMDVNKEADFSERVDYFMLKSVGCVGILKDWLERALVLTLSTPEQILTANIIEKAALRNQSLVKLTKEAMMGEEKLRDLPDDDLAMLQGLKYVPSLIGEPSSPGQPVGPRARAAARPGKRGPSRDPIGGLIG